jgi:type 1 glutamine amidotransferase
MTKMTRVLLTLLTLVFVQLNTHAQQLENVKWKNVKVLLYTKNGKGYVHDNIPSAIKAIQKLAQEKGFTVDTTRNPSFFTEENLKQYTLLLFASTNNDVFDTKEQRLAFRRYIESGGGFVGLHSVIGTERNWTWFKMMLGGSFVWHPKFQPLTLNVIDKKHSSMVGIPNAWTKNDECYFMKEMYPGIKVLLVHDLKSLNKDEEEKIKTSAGSFGNYYPAAWYQQFDGGTIWITTLGHDKKDYEDPTYLSHILRGMEFVANQSGKKDLKTAYAMDVDEPLR